MTPLLISSYRRELTVTENDKRMRSKGREIGGREGEGGRDTGKERERGGRGREREGVRERERERERERFSD